MKYKVKLRVTGTTTLTVNVNDYDEAKGAALAKFDDGDDGELDLEQADVLSVKEVTP